MILLRLDKKWYIVSRRADRKGGLTGALWDVTAGVISGLIVYWIVRRFK
jgi:hypothetical protein